jgi:pyrroloquinoline quinone biosynthesis protein E
LPARAQLEEARAAATAAKERLKGKMEILFVLPDYYSDRPKACMSGWGQRYVVVAPDGSALPCHLAHTLPDLQAENVLQRSLADIWNDSALFRAFRGEEWMQEPCRTCERRTTDYGGCRCQAFHLTGNAAATDPACGLSPDHALVQEAREAAGQIVSVERLAGKYRYREAVRASER